MQRGLGQLVLTVVKLLHVLLERQAIRRVDGGDLDEDEIEQLGLALMRQSEEIDRLRRLLGLEEQDLNLDLGPLGKLF
ncbi:gas vesicle protein GvpK [Thiocapsa sp.]|uniref:gas vesicle protein K n=1 Tax=Thiocapsa sp. TaxID=2024551 RepID=UPI001BCCD347